MTDTFGHPLEVWEKAQEQARQILIQCAIEDRITTYRDLAEDINAISLKWQSREFWEMLNPDINCRTRCSKRPIDCHGDFQKNRDAGK